MLARLERVGLLVADSEVLNLGLVMALYTYTKSGVCGFGLWSSKKPRIGGDNMDITAWSSFERKRYHFGNQDPLTKREIRALKEGIVVEPI